MGISATSRNDMMNTKITMHSMLIVDDVRIYSLPTISDAQNKALAGVGRPMKDDVCRSSRLNFASLNAEKAAMTKAV